MRHLAEVMRTPAHDIVAENVLDVRHNPRVGEQVVDPAIGQVRGADRVTILASGQNAGQQLIKIAPLFNHLCAAKDP